MGDTSANFKICNNYSKNYRLQTVVVRALRCDYNRHERSSARETVFAVSILYCPGCLRLRCLIKAFKKPADVFWAAFP